MILQALAEYFDRKAADPDSDIAPSGFEWKEIPYVIILKHEGNPINISSTYEIEGKKKKAKRFLVPISVKRGNNIAANLLWDKPEYAIGIPQEGMSNRANDQHASFIKRINDLGDVQDDGLESVKKFLRIQDKVKVLSVYEAWENLCKEWGNISFSLVGEETLVLDRPLVKEAIKKQTQQENIQETSICLISGDRQPIERLHNQIKNLKGAPEFGANIVSFNLAPFCSYRKKQGANAPIGKDSAFAYTTALNYLLNDNSTQRLQVGDASTIFWAERKSDFETAMTDIFGNPPEDHPDRCVNAVKSLFKSVESGCLAIESEKTRFYVLGLSPNASRISIRFWIVDTVAGMAGKIVQHFKDLEIIHGPKDKDTLSLFRLLVSTAVLGESENIAPNLAGDTMRSILEGLPYPRTLLDATVRRIRAEHEITYARASLIKACINRSTRFNNPENKEELKVSLDKSNTNIGYRLGRLFAALEKIQSEANPGINATIRDRFYGAASGTPVTVFSNLMRLKNHHLAKLESPGRRIFFEKLIAEVMESIEDFPSHLALADQGRFAIGYYHQNQIFYTSTKKDKGSDDSSNNTEGENSND